MSKGIPGLPTDNASPFASESFVLKHSNVPFGVVLVSDEEGLCRLPDKLDVLGKGASGGVAVGVAIRHKNHELSCVVPLASPVGSGEVEYALESRAVSVMRTGTIFVRPDVDVNRNDKVFYYVQGDNKLLGSITNSDDGGNAVELKGAVFMHGAGAYDVVEISLNMSGTVQESY